MKLVVMQEGGPAVKERAVEGFGARLADIRQRRGLTQIELGKLVAVSNRVIAYYETEEAQPPGALLADLARVLRVSADELLGLKPVQEKYSLKTARLLKRMQKIADLPPADQRTVLKLLDALHESRLRTSRPRVRASAAG